MGLFGELYLRTTRPFLPAHVTDAEVDYLVRRLSENRVPGPVLDVGCGHGRHLTALAHRVPNRDFVGVDLDPLSLTEARLGRGSAASFVRGDFFALPFRSEAFACLYAWYNTLFCFDDSRVPGLLGELARCVKPGGQLIVQGTWCEWAQAQPTARYSGVIEGGLLTEAVTYNAALGRDDIERRLTFEDGRVMAASFFIRYYPLDVLQGLLDEAGFKTMWVHGSIEEHPVKPTSPDLIVGAVKRG